MGTLLVTVVGAGHEDVAVPDDLPICDLVPRLVELCGEPPSRRQVGRWTLALPGAPPFPDSSSLSTCGVLEGTVLHLRDADDPGQVVVDYGPGPPLRSSVDLGGILPSPPTTAQRLRAAVRAFLGPSFPQADRGGVPEDGRRRGPEPPGGQPRSRLERARASWRSVAYEEQLDALITGPTLRRCVTVAVMSPRAGVGATTFTFLASTLLAHLRRDAVVAIDAAPDDRSLVRLLPPGHGLFLEDVESSPPGAGTPQPVGPSGAVGARAVTVLPTRTRLHEDSYLQGMHRARDGAGVVLVDCPPGWHGPAARAALALADHLVLVTDGDAPTMDLVAEAAHVIHRPGRPVLLVVNRMPADPGLVDLRSLAARVPDAVVVVVPEDAGLSAIAGHRFDWLTASPTLKVSMRENLAVVLAQWKGAGLAD